MADIAGEVFTAKGLQVLERNYLDVYRYERWGERTLPDFTPGNTFTPSKLELVEGKTAAPELLTEVELIRLMDNYGIGTDATIQEHIKTIQTRKYAEKLNGKFFKPTPVGHGLIKYYTQIGHEAAIARPKTRADMEKDLVKICQGALTKEQVISSTVEKFKQIYTAAAGTQQAYLDIMGKDPSARSASHVYIKITGGYCLGSFLEPNAGNGDGGSLHERYRCEKKQFTTCGSCRGPMELRSFKSPSAQSNMPPQRLLRCTNCERNYKLPLGPVSKVDHICPLCNFQVVQIKGKRSEYTVCPSCYNVQPGDIEDAANQAPGPCYKCTHSACTFAQGINGGDIPIKVCTSCGAGQLSLKRTKNGKYHLRCSTGQDCRNSTVWLPGAIKQASVQPAAPSCPSCPGNPKHLDVQIDARKVPPGTPLRHQACPMPNCRHAPHGLRVVYEMEQQTGWSRSTQGSSSGYSGSSMAHHQGEGQHASVDQDRGQVKCYGCGQMGHIKPQCPNSSSAQMPLNARNSNIKCFGCGQMGHIKPNCPNAASSGYAQSGNGNYQNKRYEGAGNHGSTRSRNSQQSSRSQPSKNYKKRVCDKCGTFSVSWNFLVVLVVLPGFCFVNRLTSLDRNGVWLSQAEMCRLFSKMSAWCQVLRLSTGVTLNEAGFQQSVCVLYSIGQ